MKQERLGKRGRVGLPTRSGKKDRDQYGNQTPVANQQVGLRKFRPKPEKRGGNYFNIPGKERGTMKV